MSTSGPPALILHGRDETNTIHITFGNRSWGATRPVVQSTRCASLAECILVWKYLIWSTELVANICLCGWNAKVDPNAEVSVVNI